MPVWRCGEWTMDLSARTAVMGILNVTPDSFSDGGRYNTVETAAAHALQLQREGADILDIGAQSIRPGHTPVSAEEEWARLEPVLEALREEIHIPISVDTYYPDVAKRAIRAGAAIINDVSGCVDNGMAAVAAQTGAGLVMMCPGDANVTETAADSFAAVRRYFRRALQIAAWAELPYERLCLDPGIGFGKSREDDLALIARLPELMSGLPEIAVLIGASRKRVVAACCGDVPSDERLPGTLALHTVAQWNGAHVLRVHDVAPAVQAVRVTDALRAARG